MRTLGKLSQYGNTEVFEEIRDSGLPAVIIHSSKYACIAGYIIGNNVYDGLLPKEENFGWKKVRKAQTSEYYKYCQNLVLLNEFCKEHNLTLIPYFTLQNQNFRLMFLKDLL